ncbi:MAG: 4'-phosphopantetheinyl transferase superfamily protein [Oscillospiraceae bacterium]|jgi:phosphopantetheine--protein transferase-like protein|nr:4'-phosphopantetheinyl transferase superfamily protein [Oscillospiraceae bacterium]
MSSLNQHSRQTYCAVVKCVPGDERFVAADLISRFFGNAVILRTERGKPYIADAPNIHFNISHTKGYAAIAAAERAVGIDIELYERLDNLRDPERFARRVFHPNEIASELSRAELWTRKEAYLKMLGTGFTESSHLLNTLDVTDARIWRIFSDGAALCTVSVALR